MVRRLVEIDPVLTPRCIIQSLLAIVETRDDSFVRIALDTLALLAVQNIKGVAQVCPPPLPSLCACAQQRTTRTSCTRHIVLAALPNDSKRLTCWRLCSAVGCVPC